MDSSFLQIIAFILIVLISVIGDQKKRSAQAKQRKAMRPPKSSPPPQIVEIVEGEGELFEPEREPDTRSEMLELIRARMMGEAPPAPLPTPTPPPPPEAVQVELDPTPIPPARGKGREKTHSFQASSAKLELPSTLGQITTSPSRRRKAAALADLRTPASLRRAIIAREVLGPPRYLQAFDR